MQPWRTAGGCRGRKLAAAIRRPAGQRADGRSAVASLPVVPAQAAPPRPIPARPALKFGKWHKALPEIRQPRIAQLSQGTSGELGGRPNAVSARIARIWFECKACWQRLDECRDFPARRSDSAAARADLKRASCGAASWPDGAVPARRVHELMGEAAPGAPRCCRFQGAPAAGRRMAQVAGIDAGHHRHHGAARGIPGPRRGPRASQRPAPRRRGARDSLFILV